MQHVYSYLALGDSYTIGEGAPLVKSFPYRAVGLLRKAGYTVSAPEVVAQTGWTTDELEAALGDCELMPRYDFVTLLIGVNNQYRGRNIIEYKEQLERLLKKSIALANGRPEHVVVLSIPDYGQTPNGQKMNPEKIAKEIDAYNSLNKALSIQFKVAYLDITEPLRTLKDKSDTVSADGLHPSETVYAEWAKQLVKQLKAMMKK